MKEKDRIISYINGQIDEKVERIYSNEKSLEILQERVRLTIEHISLLKEEVEQLKSLWVSDDN